MEKEIRDKNNTSFNKRVFIGLEMEQVKEELTNIQNQLKPYTEKGKFILKNNLHLTLQFIGEIKDRDLQPLKEMITLSAETIEPFYLTIDHLGQFTKKKRQVIWTGVEDNPILFDLYIRLQQSFQENQLLKIKKTAFLPHITIGRKMLLTAPIEEIEPKLSWPKDNTVKVTKIILYESKRINGTLRYLPIFEQLL